MMTNNYRLVSLAVLWLAAVSAPAQPDAFWCGQRLIREGMRASDILDRCGEPDSKDIVEEPIFAWRPGGGRVQTGVTVTEYWLYDRGSGRFPARLTIRENIAEQIELLTR
ncbi:MAG: DUF2845 domain-containing protein [Gammaproteobacteria bacterium]|nr:DUF2845 domain-containing protein [Gammaproteobacteria bacterium]